MKFSLLAPGNMLSVLKVDFPASGLKWMFIKAVPVNFNYPLIPLVQHGLASHLNYERENRFKHYIFKRVLNFLIVN